MIYHNPPAELPSLTENEGVFLSIKVLAHLADMYTNGDDATNPLAWPYYATAADLEGLPPFVVSVNECDPLRDEGIAFGRKLSEAGNDVCTVNVLGTPHAGTCKPLKLTRPSLHAARCD